MKRLRILAVVLLAAVMICSLFSCKRCEHSFNEGICTECGEADPNYTPPCTHTVYNNGVCAGCGAVCSHDVYAGGVCTECGSVCSHPSYSEGICTVCLKECPHSFSLGACSVCGAVDPNWDPEEQDILLYSPIVSDFKSLIFYKYVNEELPPRGAGEPEYYDALYEVATVYNPTMEMGYSYKDINGDGHLELLLTERASRIYALFTILDNSPVLVKVFEQGMGYLTPDGTVFYNTKGFDEAGGQIFLGYHFTTLSGDSLTGFSYGREDADGDSSTDDDIYYKVIGGEKTTLSKAEYDLFKEGYTYYWEYPTRLTKRANMIFNPVLPTVSTATITADFSTYEAIIETFGLMHSAVAGGKYERSHWISGRYDTGMLFKSDDDFRLYNTLLGAAVLVQNKASAVFDHARRDLNGDGVEELILIDGSYNVLAIFTAVDGSPVLVDSYNDLRTATVTESGRLLVRERPLPASEDDIRLTSYKLENGKAVPEAVFGISYVGGEASYYKLTESGFSEIEKTEYDALYAEYFGDIQVGGN